MGDDWMLVKVMIPSGLVFLFLIREYLKTRSLLRDGHSDDAAREEASALRAPESQGLDP